MESIKEVKKEMNKNFYEFLKMAEVKKSQINKVFKGDKDAYRGIKAGTKKINEYQLSDLESYFHCPCDYIFFDEEGRKRFASVVRNGKHVSMECTGLVNEKFAEIDSIVHSKSEVSTRNVIWEIKRAIESVPIDKRSELLWEVLEEIESKCKFDCVWLYIVKKECKISMHTLLWGKRYSAMEGETHDKFMAKGEEIKDVIFDNIKI